MKKTIIFLILLLPSQLIAASIDPSFEFLTIETEHFIIHYHQGLEEISKKAALTAEDIHTNLSRDLQWSPGGKTHIVLIDNTDFTNAFATVLPRNTIYIQVVPPMADMTIGEYEFAITHEYAHILTTDPARGYSKVMRKIFGKPLPGYTLLSLLTFMLTAPPNVLLPTWWLEGVATWAETEYTNSGRGRSTFTEMILRMAVEEDNIPTMDKLNGEVPYWPDGHIPYVWGLRLNMYIAEKYGKDSLGKLNITHAGKFPYVINSVPRRLFRKNYVSLYREMISALKKEQSEKIELLKKIPFTPYKIFNDRGETLTNPRYSPDGDLIAFNKRDPHEHETIVIVDSNSGRKVRTIRRLPSDHNITWSKEGDKICFTQAELHKGFNLYQDIYCYDLINNKQKRLTKGLRANAPDLSPDGSTFVFVKTERGTQNLAFLKADEKERSVKVITDYKEAQVSNPRWSSDGNLIVFSVKDNEGLSSLRTYNMNNKTFKVILKDRFNNIYPVWSPDDRFILFTSDRTGVYNLFAYSVAEEKVYQVTHVLGGAFQADILRDEKGIVFSSYDSRGFKIVTMDYNPDAWEETAGPIIKPYWQSKKTDTSKETQPIHITEPETYSPISTIAPGFWLPSISVDHEGAVIGIFTAGQDVLAYNTYFIDVGYGVESSKPYLDISYYYDRSYPTISMNGYIRPVLYSNFFDKGDYYERQKGVVLTASVPINYLESKYRFIIGYHLKQQEHLTKLTDGKFDGIEVFEGRRDYTFLGIEFSNALRYPYSISREEGRNISFYYRHYSKTLGSDIDSTEYIGSYQEHINLSFIGESQKHSVVYLNLKGAISEDNQISQQAFQLGGSSILETEFPLRGYPSRFAPGKYIATATLEYRSPIRYLFKGRNTKPFFLDRLYGALFMDAGNVWDNNRDFEWGDLKIGLGGELRLDMILGYKLYITPTIGLAHGLDKEGETNVYFTIHTEI